MAGTAACRGLIATNTRRVVIERVAIGAIVRRIDTGLGDDALGWAGALLRIELVSRIHCRRALSACCRQVTLNKKRCYPHGPLAPDGPMRVSLAATRLRMGNPDSRSARETGDCNNDRGLQEVASTVSSSGNGSDPFVCRRRRSERRRDRTDGALTSRSARRKFRHGPRHSRHNRLRFPRHNSDR